MTQKVEQQNSDIKTTKPKTAKHTRHQKRDVENAEKLKQGRLKSDRLKPRRETRDFQNMTQNSQS